MTRQQLTIYRLDAYMTGVIDPFVNSVANGGNDPNELEPTEPLSAADISKRKITTKGGTIPNGTIRRIKKSCFPKWQ